MKRIVKNKSSENKVKGRPYVSLPRDIQKGTDLWTSILSRRGSEGIPLQSRWDLIGVLLSWQEREGEKHGEGTRVRKMADDVESVRRISRGTISSCVFILRIKGLLFY
jgi:hypothetical protein